MIPSGNGFLKQDFVIEEQSSSTYKMRFEHNSDSLNIRGFTDKLEAMRQVVYKILNTERYQYVIYSRNFGIELLDLYSEPISYVIPETKRRITEALTYDKRISSVDNFTFEIERGRIHVKCVVHTVFGDVPVEKAVNV